MAYHRRHYLQMKRDLMTKTSFLSFAIVETHKTPVPSHPRHNPFIYLVMCTLETVTKGIAFFCFFIIIFYTPAISWHN